MRVPFLLENRDVTQAPHTPRRSRQCSPNLVISRSVKSGFKAASGLAVYLFASAVESSLYSGQAGRGFDCALGG
jgi:hypothetical protein